MVKNYKFFKQTNKEYSTSNNLFIKDSKSVFQSMFNSYSDFLHSIFDNDERGKLIGFRFVRRFTKPQKYI